MEEFTNPVKQQRSGGSATVLLNSWIFACNLFWVMIPVQINAASSIRFVYLTAWIWNVAVYTR
jgi:hypothetical protein